MVERVERTLEPDVDANDAVVRADCTRVERNEPADVGGFRELPGRSRERRCEPIVFSSLSSAGRDFHSSLCRSFRRTTGRAAMFLPATRIK
jgi:hypothetical protein